MAASPSSTHRETALRRRSLPRMAMLFVVCILGIAVFLLRFNQNMGPERYLYNVDFRAFYSAGQMLLAGVGADFYDPMTQYLWQSKFVEMSSLSQLLVFLNPPFVVVPFALVAMLPMSAAYLVWATVNVILLAIVCYLLVEMLADAGHRAQYAVLVLAVLFLPVIVTLMQGQLSFLLMIGLLMSWRAFQAGKELESGLWLGLLLVKPQLALVPALVMLWQRQWRALAGLTLAGAVSLAISLFLVGWSGLKGWARGMAVASGWGDMYGIHPQRTYTWRGILHRLLGTDNAGEVMIWWLAGSMVALALLFWVWRRRVGVKIPPSDIQWALLVIVMLFVSPHTYIHDLSLLLIPGALIARYVVRRRRGVG